MEKPNVPAALARIKDSALQFHPIGDEFHRTRDRAVDEAARSIALAGRRFRLDDAQHRRRNLLLWAATERRRGTGRAGRGLRLKKVERNLCAERRWHHRCYRDTCELGTH